MIIGSNLVKWVGILVNVKVDFMVLWDGFFKFIVLFNYIKFYLGFLLFFCFFVNWGYVIGFVGYGVDVGIKLMVLVFLMLIFCVVKGVI